MAKRVLVTGGTGLVGSNIPDNFSSDLIKLSSVDYNLLDYTSVYRMIVNVKPNILINCAGRVGGVVENMKYPAEFFYQNMLMNLNILHACYELKVEKVVSFLSTCIFPDKMANPLTSGLVHLGPPHPSNFGYAYAKRMVDVMSRAYRKQYGCKFVTVAPTNIFGPFDNFNLESAHVIPSLIHKCYLAKKNNTDFTVWGNGRPIREFIYVKDLIKLLYLAVNYWEDSSKPLILSSPSRFKIKDIAQCIADLMRFKGNIVFDKSKPNGQNQKNSDWESAAILHFKQYGNEFEYTDFTTALSETIYWFIDNYPNIRGVNENSINK